MARCGTLQPLSDDALHHIGDLLMQPSFSRVCRRLWGLLRGHHAVLCHGNRGLASATAALPAHGGRLRTLTIRDRQPPVDHRRGPATADAQDSASDTDKPDGAPPPLLHTLRLHLPGGHMTRLALAVLHGLGDCQHLQTLEVDFSRRAGAQGLGDPDGARQRGDRVAVADAAWCRPPAALRELRLSCTDTPLDPGLLPVKALQALRALQTLTLSLARAHAGLRVLRRLAQLQDCPALTALALHLDGNGLTEEHAAVLAGARFPALRSLTLSLGHNRIGAGGARLLPAAPELRALRLGLGRAGLSAEGLEALGRSLRDAPELRALTVDLARNRLGSRAAEALGAALGHCAGLETLCLDLGHNDLRADGAHAVAQALARCSDLHVIHLQLQSNHLRSAGVAALSTGLGQCKALQVLSLGLARNVLARSESQALDPLFCHTDPRPLRSLHLDLSQNALDPADAVGLNNKCFALGLHVTIDL